MNQIYHTPFPASLSVTERNRVLRNTYALLALSMLPTIAGALLGMQLNFIALFKAAPVMTPLLMFGVMLGSRRPFQHVTGLLSRCRHNVGQFRLPARQRAGFVERDAADRSGPFKVRTAFDQHAFASGTGEGGNNRDRR